MKTLLKKFSTRTRFRHLQSAAQMMIILHLFYFLGDYLSNIFVSVYIWKLHQNLTHVAWFYVYESISCFFLSTLAGQLVKRKSPSVGIGIGTLFLALFYFCMLVLQEQAIHYLLLLGILKGMGISFYWTSFHFLVLLFTNGQERHLYNGYLEVTSAISSLITPIISGGVIYFLHGNQGYIVIFLLSLLFFLTSTILSFFIKLPELPSKSFQFKPILSDFIHPKKRWFWGMQGNLMQGISDGIFMMLPGVFYFLFLKHEWNLGLLTSFFALMTLISNFLVGHLLSLEHRHKSILFATLIHATCASSVLFSPSWITILLFGIGNSLVKPWYFVPSVSAYYDYIDQKPKKEEYYIEYLVSREWALTAGRAISLLFLLWLTTHFRTAQESLQWYTFFLALGLPYIWFAVYRLNAVHSKKD